MQADLGGAFYEMAIRDHVRMDVLTRKAAELQRVDAELLALERMLELERSDAAGNCPSCGTPYGHAVRFCAQCGHSLVPRRSPHEEVPGHPLQKATAAAASLTGKRFGLLVASSLVATSAIVATALTRTRAAVSPLAALVGQSLAADNTPAETAPPASPGPAAGSAGSSAGPASGAAPRSAGRSPLRHRPPRRKRAARLKSAREGADADDAADRTDPEAGPIKHVFVISLTSPGYDAAFGAALADALPGTELRPQGELLTDYSLLDEPRCPTRSRRSAASRRTRDHAAAPATRVPDGAEAEPNVLRAPAASTRSKRRRSPTSSTAGRFSWRAYMEGMADPTTGKPGNCVHPARRGTEPAGPRRLHGAPQPVRLLPLAARPRRLRGQRRAARPARRRPAQGRRRPPNSRFIAPTLCNAGSSRPVPRRREAGGPAAADAFLADLGAEDPRLARLQDGRPADRHLRRDRPAAGATRRTAGPRPHLRNVAPCCSRSSSPPAPPTPAPTTPTRCCARSRTSSPSNPSASPVTPKPSPSPRVC